MGSLVRIMVVERIGFRHYVHYDEPYSLVTHSAAKDLHKELAKTRDIETLKVYRVTYEDVT